MLRGSKTLKGISILIFAGILWQVLEIFSEQSNPSSRNAHPEEESNKNIQKVHVPAVEAASTVIAASNPKRDLAPSETLTVRASAEPAKLESPEAPYLVERAADLLIHDRLVNYEKIEFPPAHEPAFIGINEQGFEQFEYSTPTSAKVIQWKRGDDLYVEEIRLPSGDTITRRTDRDEEIPPEVTYERKDGSFWSLKRNHRGDVTDMAYKQGEMEVWQRVDDQGRVHEVYRR